MGTQLDFAKAATTNLLLGFHKEDAGDRCCIGTFGSNYSLVQPFTSSQLQIHRALPRLSPDGGMTRFRDSICDFVEYFRTYARKDRPWLIIVITDGDDNKSRMAPSQVGAYLKAAFTDVRSADTNEKKNYMFTVGIGDGVNQSALENLAAHGGFRHFGLESFNLLEAVFQLIALQVVQSITGVTFQVGGQRIRSFDEKVAIVRRGIDYGFLIDNSTSMSDQVSLGGRGPRRQDSSADYPQPGCDCTIL